MTMHFPPPPEGCGVIYALSDPRKPTEIRYVGKTERPLANRLAQHVHARHRTDTQCHRLMWIKKLFAQGRRPLIWPLEVCPLAAWEERERYWIAFFRPLGLLTNGTDGGERGTLTPESRARLSATTKGRKMTPLQRAAFDARKDEFVARTIARNKRGLSPESRAKVAAILRGRKMTPAQRAAWESRKDVLIAQTIARNKLGWSDETRAKQSALRKGKPMTSAQRTAWEARRPELVARLIARNKRGWTEATRQKQHAVRKGRPMTTAQKAAWEVRKAEHMARLIERNKRGWSAETRAKQIALRTGSKWTDRQRDKYFASGAREKLIARNQRGLSADSREKAAAKLRGRKLKPAHKAALLLSAALSNERRKSPVVSDNGLQFASLADAAKATKCSIAGVHKSLRTGRPCRGIKWTRLTKGNVCHSA